MVTFKKSAKFALREILRKENSPLNNLGKVHHCFSDVDRMGYFRLDVMSKRTLNFLFSYPLTNSTNKQFSIGKTIKIHMAYRLKSGLPIDHRIYLNLSLVKLNFWK